MVMLDHAVEEHLSNLTPNNIVHLSMSSHSVIVTSVIYVALSKRQKPQNALKVHG